MIYCIRTTVFCLLAALLLAGCLSLGGGNSLASPRSDSDRYTLLERSATSQFGCRYSYRVYQPDAPRTKTSLVLGHGFLRDQDNMVGLGRAVANAGIRAVTLDYCNMRPWNGHHKRNAQDMRDLAESLGISDDVIFAGFSAGALAAVLAADNDTRAIMALDLVDQAELGATAITNLTTPLIGISGPASGCNANNNGDTVYKTRAKSALSSLLKIDYASHCEFESPSNWLCETACGDKDNDQSANMQRASIIHRVVNMLTPYLS